MKSILNVTGILLILIGAGTLIFQGYSYNEPEKVAQIGEVQITATEQKTVHFSPILGGIALVGGIVLLVIGARNNRK